MTEAAIDETAGTLLLVDDESLVRRTMANTLRRTGYEVFAEDSATNAIARVPELVDILDVLIVDFRLSDTSRGSEVIHAYREVGCACSVVVYTGVAREEAAHAARVVGADAFVCKPRIDALYHLDPLIAKARIRRGWPLDMPPDPYKDLRPGDRWYKHFVNTLREAGALTPRETEAIEQSGMGSCQAAANTMGIKIDTLYTHLKHAYTRLGARSLWDLVRVCTEHLNRVEQDRDPVKTPKTLAPRRVPDNT